MNQKRKHYNLQYFLDNKWKFCSMSQKIQEIHWLTEYKTCCRGVVAVLASGIEDGQ